MDQQLDQVYLLEKRKLKSHKNLLSRLNQEKKKKQKQNKTKNPQQRA